MTVRGLCLAVGCATRQKADPHQIAGRWSLARVLRGRLGHDSCGTISSDFPELGEDWMNWGGASAIAAPGVPSDLESERSRRTGDVVPHQPAPLQVALRLGLLQWSVGGFCGIVGALTFVTPHQFVGPAYRMLRPYLPWWGLLCLLGAGALISVALLSPRRPVMLLAHWLAAAPILLLGISAG